MTTMLVYLFTRSGKVNKSPRRVERKAAEIENMLCKLGGMGLRGTAWLKSQKPVVASRSQKERERTVLSFHLALSKGGFSGAA